jgi:hypothetical protein
MFYLGLLVLALLGYAIVKLPFGLTKLTLLFFVVFNFLGLLGYSAGYRTFTLVDFHQNFPAAVTNRALLIAMLGIVCFLVGTWMTSASRRIDAAVDRQRFALVAVIYSLVAMVLPGSNIFDLLSHFSNTSASALLLERLKTRPSAVMVAVDYVLTSIPALYALALYLDKRCNILWPAALVFIAAITKFATLQKEPFMVFLLQCGVLLYARRPFRPRNVLIGGAFAFSCLTGLYALYQGGALNLLALSAAERIFMRTAAPYCYVAKWIPATIDYASLNILPFWANFWGATYIPLSESLFKRASIVFVAGGTMSIPNSPWFYAAFGWLGIIFGSFFSGIVVGALDNIVVPKSGPARWATIAMLMPIPFYLSETTIFGAMSGFGGALMIIHALLLNRIVRPAPKRAGLPRAAPAIPE